MSSGRFPKPYVSDVPASEDPIMIGVLHPGYISDNLALLGMFVSGLVAAIMTDLIHWWRNR